MILKMAYLSLMASFFLLPMAGQEGRRDSILGKSRASSDDNVAMRALFQRVVLPIVTDKVAELDKEIPKERHYGLKGESVGRNGLREEVENHDIFQNGKKVCFVSPLMAQIGRHIK
jgi:hypothetical protein